MILLQLLVNTAALGAAYALVALGFVLVLNTTGAVNFAQGDLVTAGGFVALSLAGVLPPLPGVALLPLVVLVMAGLGLAVAALGFLPLKDRPPVSVFISTIALGIMLSNTENALFGAAPRAVPPLLSGGALAFGGVTVGRQALAVMLVAALLIGCQHLLLNHTGLGRQLRATAQDRAMAEALGVRVGRMIALSFALAGALAGAAGLLLAHDFFVTPADGMGYMLKAYIAVTIGGWGSLAGALAGAFLIAAFDVLLPGLPALLPGLAALPGTQWLFSQTTATIALYLLLLAILARRPQGLFGEPVTRRA
jgi:branched-chain amino acid transport system permease protein